MNIKIYIFFFVIIFPLQTITVAKSLDKGEFDNLSSSPLSVLQEKDSLLKKEYREIQALFEKEKYSQSLERVLILLNNNKQTNNQELDFLGNFLIGNILRKRNNHKRALEYFKKSLKILQSNESYIEKNLKFYDDNLKGKKALANTFLRLGTEYFKLDNNDSAAYYFKRVIEIPNLTREISSIKASAYGNLSATYLTDSLYTKAKKYALKAVEEHQKNNKKVSEAAALGNLASIYLEEKKYQKAKEIYSRAINLIENNNNIKAVKYKEDLYYNLAWTLYLLKDYSAYDYQEKSYLIKDDLRDKEIKRLVKGVFEKNKIDLEKQKAVTIKNQVELKKLQDRKTTLFFSILSLLVIIISGVILYNYKLRQKNLKLKLSQNQLIQKQSIEKIKSESQIKILNATLDGKESERKQIAETLHDSVSTLLSSATLHLQATKKQFNGSTPIEIDKTQKIITEASQKIRDLSHTLVSSVLLKFGLNFALKDMAEKYSNSAITINTDLKNLKRYQQGFEIKTHNIIQEFVNNVLKHSKAKNATVFLEEKEEKLFLRIEDDGQGFNINEVSNKDGLGINQIDARIQMMKGKFVIESELNKGTVIIVELPIVEKEPVNYV